MQPFRTRLALILLLAVAPATSAQTRWATYANARFGTTADYPADLFSRRDPEPENGDGVRLHTADGRSTVDCFDLTYPAREKKIWDAIAARISKSLRAGKGIDD